jgi:hypothetical protein
VVLNKQLKDLKTRSTEGFSEPRIASNQKACTYITQTKFPISPNLLQTMQCKNEEIKYEFQFQTTRAHSQTNSSHATLKQIKPKPFSNNREPSHSQTIGSQAILKPPHFQSSTDIFQVSYPAHGRFTYHCSKLFHESSHSQSPLSSPSLTRRLSF